MRRPIPGDIVHYQLRPDQHGGPRRVAAMVLDDPYHGSEFMTVTLRVFIPAVGDKETIASFAATPTPGHWSWPQREEKQGGHTGEHNPQ